MFIREARDSDAEALANVFFHAVREGSAPAYTEQQRIAWAGQHLTADAWALRIEGLVTFVAEQDGVVTGFMSMRMDDGYLDLAFVLPEVQRTGVAVKIYGALESHARAAGLRHLTSHASHMARPFFERQGWQVLKAMQAELNGATLDNWLMEKSLW